MSDALAADLALLLLRGVLGAVMLAHGWNHVWGGGRIAGTSRWFASLGMRPPRLHAWLASVSELVAGALLVLGLMTPLAGAAVLGTMLVAWVVNHRGNGFFIFRPGEGWEYVMVLAALGVVVAALGAGRWSLDAVLGLEGLSGGRGVLTAVVLGGGGAAVTVVLGRRGG